MNSHHTTEAAEARQTDLAEAVAVHTSAMSVVKWTDADGVEHKIAACNRHVPAVIREHLHQRPAILPAQHIDGRRAQCGQAVPTEYELIVSRRSDLSGEGYEVYQARVLEFGGHVGEYRVAEEIEVTIAPAIEDAEETGIPVRAIDFANAVDIAERILAERGYTRTQAVTYKGGYADGRVAR